MLAIACGPPDEPRQVRLAVRLAPTGVQGDEVDWEEARLGAQALRVQPCPGAPGALSLPIPWTTGLEGNLGLLDALRPRIPVGPWCGLDLLVTGPLVLAGTLGTGGAAVALRLDLPDLGTAEDVRLAEIEITRSPTEAGGVDTRAEAVPLLIELGAPAWLEGVARPEAGVIEPGSEGYTPALEALLQGTALYRDVDRDGLLSEAERDAGPISALTPY